MSSAVYGGASQCACVVTLLDVRFVEFLTRRRSAAHEISDRQKGREARPWTQPQSTHEKISAEMALCPSAEGRSSTNEQTDGRPFGRPDGGGGQHRVLIDIGWGRGSGTARSLRREVLISATKRKTVPEKQ